MASRQLTLGDLVYRLGFENEQQFIQKLGQLMDRGEREAEKGGREAGQGWQQQFRATFTGAALGSFLGGALTQAFAMAVSAARQFAAESISEFKIYEQGLIQLKLAGETNLGALEDRIAAVAKLSRVFSRTDVSIALGGLVKAGYDVETAFNLVEAAVLGASSEVNEATGEFGDLGSTAVNVGNILRALQLDTSQTGRVMDVMAKAAQDSNLDVSDLVEIISRVGPTARLANLEIEDLAAMAAVLSNNGMDASLISTGLRSVLQSLINPTGDLADELDALGVSIVTRDGEIRSVNEVLDGLHELTQRGGEGLQTLTAAVGSYGSTAASSLGQSSDAVKQFRTDLDNANGSAQQLADTMRDSGAGAAAEMEARMNDARVELGEKLMPVMIQLYEDVLPPLIRGLEQLIGLWNDWYFLLHGTTPELERSQEQFESQFGAGELEVLQHIQQLQEERRKLQQERDDILAGVGMGGPGAVDDDDRLFVSEVIDPEIARLDEQIRRRRAYFQSLREQNAAAKGVPGADPDATNDQADANRNLADSNNEVNESLKERPQDPLVEESGRIHQDLRRLQLGFDQGNLSMREYVEHVQAHVRRLDGLYAQATDPEQTLAILRARQAALQEIKRVMGDGSAPSDIVGIPDAGGLAGQPTRRPESQAELQQLIRDEEARQAAIAEARVRQNQRTVDELQQVEQGLYQWREDQEEARAQKQQEVTDELLQIEQAQGEFAIQQDVERRQRAAAEEQERQEKIAEARVRNNERVTNELIELEGAYYDYLEDEDEKREQREEEQAAARARRTQREQVQQALRNLNLGAFVDTGRVGILDRARGEVVKLTEAQRALGQATRDDVRAALEDQIRSLDHLLDKVTEGSELYYELVAALQAAKGALADLNAEVAANTMPDLTDEASVRAAARAAEAEIANIQAQIAAGPDAALLAALEGRLAFLQSLLQVLRQAMADFDAQADAEAQAKAIQAEADALAGRIVGIAESFPRAIVQGIQNGDIGSALQHALGGAADFFLQQMLDAILGPIKEQLAAAIAESLATQAAGDAASGAVGAAGGLAALDPTFLVLGGIALLASTLISAGQNRARQAQESDRAVQRTVSGAPSITYNLSANVEVNPGSNFGDPAFEARLRAFVVDVATDLYRRVQRTN